MYKSPIEVYVNNMLNQIRQQEENQIVAEVSQAVGVNVKKEELIKALNYDRNQYHKGYEDGKRASKWIPVSERMPEKDEVVLITNKWHEIDKALYIGDEMFDIIINYLQKEEVIAWQPLPQPYKVESEDEE